MLLKNCKVGEQIIVNKINLSEDFCFRLNEIGITNGVKLKVFQKCSFGSFIIEKGAERIGIDSKIASNIEGISV